jgi:lariat debranching enzyme
MSIFFQLSQPTIFVSHDWPQSIEHHGNLKNLLRNKPFFRQDIENGELGSPPMMGLLRNLKPEWWFSAHLHTRFEAKVVHGPELVSNEASGEKVQNPDEIVIDDDEVDVDTSAAESSTAPTTDTMTPVSELPKQNPDEITLDEEEDAVEVLPPPAPTVSQSQGSVTRFLALDKCLPKRQFLEVRHLILACRTLADGLKCYTQVVDIPVPEQWATSVSTTSDGTSCAPVLEFNPEWLAITRAFHPWFSTTRNQPSFPDENEARSAVTASMQWVVENLQSESL